MTDPNHQKFNNLCNHLMMVAQKLDGSLEPGDVSGAFFATGIEHMRDVADVPTIARSALGPPARTASAAQMRAFNDAFTGYISRKYGKRFREFIGGRIEVKDARALKSFHEVRAVAVLKGQAPFAVSFMVSDRSGSDKFFDLLIEGISLLKSEKAEIGAMLDRRRGNIDALIADLRSAG